MVEFFRRHGFKPLHVVARVPKPDRLDSPRGASDRCLNAMFDLLDRGALYAGLPGGNIGVYGRKIG